MDGSLWVCSSLAYRSQRNRTSTYPHEVNRNRIAGHRSPELTGKRQGRARLERLHDGSSIILPLLI